MAYDSQINGNISMEYDDDGGEAQNWNGQCGVCLVCWVLIRFACAAMRTIAEMAFYYHTITSHNIRLGVLYCKNIILGIKEEPRYNNQDSILQLTSNSISVAVQFTMNKLFFLASLLMLALNNPYLYFESGSTGGLCCGILICTTHILRPNWISYALHISFQNGPHWFWVLMAVVTVIPMSISALTPKTKSSSFTS